MAESKELTKEQQVRALREARYKKRLNPRLQAVTIAMPETPPVTRVAPVAVASVAPVASASCPQCQMYEVEIKRLKRELATTRMRQELAVEPVKPAGMSSTERSRRFRAKRKQAKDG